MSCPTLVSLEVNRSHHRIASADVDRLTGSPAVEFGDAPAGVTQGVAKVEVTVVAQLDGIDSRPWID